MADRISFVWIFTFVLCSLSKECPSSWKRVHRQCFRLVSSLAYDSIGFPTVYHARQACKQQNGGDLAHIHDSYYENEALSLIRMMPWDAIPRYVYIGLTDIRKAGHFEWMNQSPVGYTDWAPDEPNDGHKSGSEACVAVKSPDKYWTSPNDTEWHDYPCCEQAYIQYALCSLDLDEESMAANSNSSRASIDILHTECNSVDECSSNPCYHGGTCVDDVHAYTCSCAFGYTGDHCQHDITCPRRGLRPATVGTLFEGDPSEDQSLDSTLSVTCIKGYSFSEAGNPIAKRFNCTVDGWKLIDREVIRCPPIPTWKGLLTNSTDRNIDSFTNYSCQEGRKFNDSDTHKWSICNMSGSWDPPLALCVEKEPLDFQVREVKKPVEAAGAVVVGTFGLIFLITELIVFVLLDLNVYRKQLIFGYGNIKSWIRYRNRETQFQAVPH